MAHKYDEVDIMIRSLLWAIAFLSFSAVLKADPMSDAQAHAETFKDAFIGRNAEAVLELYAPDATVIWPGNGEEAHGKEEIKNLIIRAMQSLPPDSQYVIRHLRAVPIGDDYSVTVGRWEHSFTGDDGTQQVTEVRTMEIIRKREGKTYYVFDHASIGVPHAVPANEVLEASPN